MKKFRAIDAAQLDPGGLPHRHGLPGDGVGIQDLSPQLGKHPGHSGSSPCPPLR